MFVKEQLKIQPMNQKNFPYALIPERIIPNLHARELAILMYMGGYSRSGTQDVWIRQETVAEKIGCSVRTVGRNVRSLIRKQLIRFTGRWHQGRHKLYEICAIGEKNLAKSTSATFVRSPIAPSSADLRQFCPKLIEQEIKLKEQTTSFEIFKKDFSENEKIAVKQKLTAIGLKQAQIQKLTTSPSKTAYQNLKNQIDHLQFALERGDQIKNPAAWLLRAIEEEYSLPKEIDPKAIEQQKAEASKQEACEIAKDAKRELFRGNHSEAERLATKSLEIADNSEAKEVLKECSDRAERKRTIALAESKIDQSTKQILREDAKASQMAHFKRFGQSESQILRSLFFEQAVQSQFEKSLLAWA